MASGGNCDEYNVLRAPAYILPDELPDMKTGLAMPAVKHEPQNLLVTYSTSPEPPIYLKPELPTSSVKEEQHDSLETVLTDDQLDLKPHLTSLGVKGEHKDSLTTSSTLTDNSSSGTPSLSMSIVIKEEVVDTAGPSSSAQDGSMVGCAHCDYTCLRRNQLDGHVKRRHSHIGRNGKCKCEWCEHSTDNVGNYNRHRLTHTGERPHCCDDCGRTFNRLSNLTQHRRLHTGQRPYSCDVCGKSFAYSSHLTAHGHLHTGEKIRQCEQCGATFSRASDYVTHMKAHSGVKAHPCQVCSSRFVTRSSLTRHMRTHTGERPYGCSFCLARFSEQSAMKKHAILLHTHDYRHRCGRCGKGFVAPCRLRKHMDKCVVIN